MPGNQLGKPAWQDCALRLSEAMRQGRNQPALPLWGHFALIHEVSPAVTGTASNREYFDVHEGVGGGKWRA